MAEVTPLQKVTWIKAKHEVRFARLSEEANDLMEARGRSVNERAKRFMAIADEIGQAVAPHAACRRKCSHCCRQSVSVSTWEAHRIGRAIGREPNYVAALSQERIDSMFAQRAQFSGVPCPFLKDDECSVYAVRPLACRVHFNMGDDPELCDIVKRPGASVPYFNAEVIKEGAAALFLDSGVPFGDIREFFPAV